MKICYPCADVFTPDDYAACPRCGRALSPAAARRWMERWRRAVLWVRGAVGR